MAEELIDTIDENSKAKQKLATKIHLLNIVVTVATAILAIVGIINIFK